MLLSPGRRSVQLAAWLLTVTAVLLVSLAGLLRPGDVQAANVTLTVDGAQRFQRIDGFGVNANPKNFMFSDLRPAIDQLNGTLGATLWRVDIYGTSTWIDQPSHLNASYYPVIYETAPFQALWQTLAYLNSRGATVVLSASGVLPVWMGGTYLDSTMEDQFVEMICSVVDYGRRVKGIPITMLSPLNEVDQGPPEGPNMDQVQYARVLGKVQARLQALGYSDVRLMPPDISNVTNAGPFISPITADDGLMASIDHFSFHSYSGSAGNVDSLLKGSPFPNSTFWMTEWSEATTDGFLDNGAPVADEWAFARTMTDDLIALLNQGPTAVLAWDAWDNVHDHCGCGQLSHWGLLALDSTNYTYSPKKRFYTNAQVFEFVPAGWQRIGASPNDSSVNVVAFSDTSGSHVTIVGHNTAAATSSLTVSLANLASASTLHWYETNSSENLVQKSDVSVVGGTFSVDVPADSFFTFSTAAAFDGLFSVNQR